MGTTCGNTGDMIESLRLAAEGRINPAVMVTHIGGLSAAVTEEYDKALKEVGADNAAVFEVHKMMMEDEDYLDSIYNMIRGELINAEYAVAATADTSLTETFVKMGIDELSVSPSFILPVREAVRNLC